MAHQKKPNRQKPRTEHWVHVCSGMDGSEKVLMCFGVNLHDYKWQHTGRTAKVKDPHYDAYHDFPVYAVDINGKKREFAYGEYCMCIFGLFARG